jgi:small subunit ribosomal protein S15
MAATVVGTFKIGSVPEQISRLSGKIKLLTEHLKQHPKDRHSKMGLTTMVNQRRRLLVYLKRKQYTLYEQLIAELGIRKVA